MKKIYILTTLLMGLGLSFQSCKSDSECKGLLEAKAEVACDGNTITITDKSSPICAVKQVGWVAISGFDPTSDASLIKFSTRETPISISKGDIPEGYNFYYVVENINGNVKSTQLDLCEEDVDDFVYGEEEMEEEEPYEETIVEKSDQSSSYSENKNASKKPTISDQDNDGIPDSKDNCRSTYNPNQKDSDGDGLGDACDNTPLPKKASPPPSPPKPADADNDGVPDSRDNCRTVYNPNQKDSDGDGLGDVCDSTPLPPKPKVETKAVNKPTPKKPSPPKVADMDKDGIPDSEDNCRTAYNPDQKDSDGDGLGDKCDSTPLPPKPKVESKPALPPDADNDGVPDTRDNCKSKYNPDQKDSDGDGIGDPCDETPVKIVTKPDPPKTMVSDEEPDFLNKAYAGNRLRKKCAEATEVSSTVNVEISPKQNFEILNAKVVSKGYGKLSVKLKEGSRTIKSYSGLSLIPGKREIGFSGLYEYLEKGKTYTLELIPSGTTLMSMAACEKANYSDMRVDINQPSDGVVLFDLFINY